MILTNQEILNQIDTVLRKYDEWEKTRPHNFEFFQRKHGLEIYPLLCDTVRRFAPSNSAFDVQAEYVIETCEIDDPDSLYESITGIISVLKSLKIAFESNLLSEINELIHADIFNDFLEMAEYLLSEGYKDSAAVMVGGVLEDHLKKLCQKNSIPIIKSDGTPIKTNQLNSDLYNAKIYNRGDNKNITAWLEIRNNAAHAKYSEYSEEQVKISLQGIRDFISRFPA